MEQKEFYIVDVFAEDKYKGNQLAVFLNCHDLTSKQMQDIAKEINFSETTFILSNEEQNDAYDVRIFTPNEEVPFAGHPTLGTAYVIKNNIQSKPTDRVNLNLKVGKIPVTFDHNELVWMKQNEPTFDNKFQPEEIANILSIDTSDIDTRFPIEDVSTGLPFIIVPLKDLQAVKKAKLNIDQYYKLIEKTRAKAILLFSPETYRNEHDINARVFTEYYGIPEDAATGSANGCLAGYLVKNRYFGEEQIDISVEQGYEIERPSLIKLKAEVDLNGKIQVTVGGKVVHIAKGVWSV